MKVIIQRVKEAKCIVNEKVISAIKTGYMILVGFTHTDTFENVAGMARKISTLRIFDDHDGKINRSIKDVKGEILSISQFTLYANTHKSNRPSFTDSMSYEQANELYLEFNRILNDTYQIRTYPGEFGAHMDIMIINDGPVTIEMEN